jgi:PLP dependent protein
MDVENYSVIRNEVDQIARRCGRLPEDIMLVAVSKGYPEESVKHVYEEGCRNFGESRLVEALPKIESLPSDIYWHLIGTLQKNKVRKAIGKFVLIHSVDSLDLAKKISQCSNEMSLSTSILLQVNVSGEKSKHGMQPEECQKVCEEIYNLPGLHVRGLMTIAPLTEDKEEIRCCFRGLRQLRDELALRFGKADFLPDLSMGMSHDYPIAIEEGATLLRIGTAIFKQ